MAGTWIVVFLLANHPGLEWMPFDHNKCVEIEDAVATGKAVALTLKNGTRLKVLDAMCLTKDGAEKAFGFRKGTPV